MTDQKQRFVRGEANAWFARNKDKLRACAKDPDRDQVVAALHRQSLRPTSVLEIGASNGWRLHAIAEAFGAKTAGLEPSEEAVADGRKHYPGVELRLGTAESLPFDSDQFDLVIFGFCLYLSDPKDLFTIAADPFPWYASADAFVLPTRYEGMPNALLEAMAMGLPVIVTDACPGPLEYVEDGESGLVVPVENGGALARAMDRIMGDGDLANRLGSEGRRRVRADTALPRVMAAWNRVLGERRVTAAAREATAP